MKNKIFLLAVLAGLFSANEIFAQDNGTAGGSGSVAPAVTPGGAINEPRSLDPRANQPNVARPMPPNGEFSQGNITNGTGWGSLTNGGKIFTNGFGSGSMTNQLSKGGLNNGRRINPNNPYANYTNPYSTYTNPNSPNVNPYATDPRGMERGGTVTNK